MMEKYPYTEKTNVSYINLLRGYEADLAGAVRRYRRALMNMSYLAIFFTSVLYMLGFLFIMIPNLLNLAENNPYLISVAAALLTASVFGVLITFKSISEARHEANSRAEIVERLLIRISSIHDVSNIDFEDKIIYEIVISEAETKIKEIKRLNKSSVFRFFS